MDLIGARDLPLLTRRSYYYEFVHILLWSGIAALVEGGQFAGIVVALSFGGSATLKAVAVASPFASMLLSLVWGSLCASRPKIQLLSLACVATCLLCLAIAGVPHGELGAILFLVLVGMAQIFFWGVITVRSAVWKSNYPLAVRGQITSRLQRARVFIIVLAGVIAAAVCRSDPALFRWIFAVSGLLGLLSLIPLRKIHIRGERAQLLRHRRDDSPDDLSGRTLPPFDLPAFLKPGTLIGQARRILREDHRYRRYLSSQFLLGAANLMTIVMVIEVVTSQLTLGDESGYWISTVLIVILPKLMLFGTLGRWGRLYDRLGVVRFRVVNCLCWTSAIVCGMVAFLVLNSPVWFGAATFPLAVVFLALYGMGQGMGKGGGSLAWNLGHLHFAHPDDAEIYMGIHVSLTGLRGLAFPFLGMWLFGQVGWLAWVISVVLALMSTYAYLTMAKAEQREGRPEVPAASRLSGVAKRKELVEAR